MLNALEQEQLLELGKKHQKMLESTSINAVGYKTDNNVYYLAFYQSKFTNSLKGCAIIPFNSDNANAPQSILENLMYFSVSSNGALSIEKRAKQDISVWEEIHAFLKWVIDESLDGTFRDSYTNAYKAMEQMIEFQKDMVQLHEEVTALDQNIEQDGYFTEESINTMVQSVIKADLIQYRQFSWHYENCIAFDKVYDHVQQENLAKDHIDIRLLHEMTSEKAQMDLRDSLERLEKGESVKGMSDEEIYDTWMKSYEQDLDNEVSKMKKIMRFP
ncbi:hypothetical protein JNUCC1_03072 [Lentibacillus sp. JNUCC-1]|uniref:hypothetical protein n=1 Tax=Lentibacillus sp. JNUCC-1 TaxID=2654513 RepID=UPI0012E71761|nr:hypothetical protein [Lentibacillus sp. JNUCC-1]MUV39199.1 hypothetical protein [Lentibacillus sp. JNUCC-1]